MTRVQNGLKSFAILAIGILFGITLVLIYQGTLLHNLLRTGELLAVELALVGLGAVIWHSGGSVKQAIKDDKSKKMWALIGAVFALVCLIGVILFTTVDVVPGTWFRDLLHLPHGNLLVKANAYNWAYWVLLNTIALVVIYLIATGAFRRLSLPRGENKTPASTEQADFLGSLQ